MCANKQRTLKALFLGQGEMVCFLFSMSPPPLRLPRSFNSKHGGGCNVEMAIMEEREAAVERARSKLTALQTAAMQVDGWVGGLRRAKIRWCCGYAAVVPISTVQQYVGGWVVERVWVGGWMGGCGSVGEEYIASLLWGEERSQAARGVHVRRSVRVRAHARPRGEES